MASLPELKRMNKILYDELRENLLALRQDEKKRAAFVGKVSDFLETVHEAGRQTRSVDEHKWLNSANVNWHSAITTVIGVPIKIKPMPLPERMSDYEQEVVPLAPEFQRLPLEVAIELARKAVAKTPSSSAREQLQEYIAELQRIGYRVDERYSEYFKSMLVATKNILDVQKKIDVVKDILEASEHFVIEQQGIWGDQEWEKHLHVLAQKGFETSKEFLGYYGDVTESMKEIYSAAAKTRNANEVLNEITTHTVAFLADEKAVWDHSAWEDFLKDLQGLGLQWNQEQTTYLGNLLEAGKRLYLAAFGIKSQVQ